MCVRKIVIALALLIPGMAWAQFQGNERPAGDSTLVLSLDDAIKIALSENTSVKVADMEIQRLKYARKGTYAALFPQVNGSGSYQRTIKRQVMYMGGGDDSGSGGGASSMFAGILEPIEWYLNQLMAQAPGPIEPYVPKPTPEDENTGGIAVGRLNTWSAGINASMPLVNAQLWENISISADQVELAVEKARESRLGTVTSVKQAYYAVLLAKEAFEVYKQVYENAVENFRQTEMKYNVQKASELDYTRAKSNVAAAIPNVYNAESSIMLALWQLKAVMGLELEREIDVTGSLDDYAQTMFRDMNEGENADLERNTTLRQLDMQAEQLAKTVRMQQYAYIPSLNLSFAYSFNAMADNFKFSEYRWTPYSYVGLSLSIPIFSGGQRHYAIKQTRVQADELALQRQNTERQLRISIHQSLQTMDTAMRTYDSARDAAGTAQKAYDIAAKSYQLGKSTLTDLSNTELTLTQTKLQAVQAVYNFVVAKAGLEQTLGYDFTEE
jgi:outer membrane protein TolC